MAFADIRARKAVIAGGSTGRGISRRMFDPRLNR
jgi:hypothetical protein